MSRLDTMRICPLPTSPEGEGWEGANRASMNDPALKGRHYGHLLRIRPRTRYDHVPHPKIAIARNPG